MRSGDIPRNGVVMARGVRKAILVAGAVCAATMMLGTPARLAAQSNVLVQGVADLELWKTDARSALLSRAGGRLAPAATLHLWTAWELPAGLTLYALGEAEAARGEHEVELGVDQAGVRWARSQALVFDAGIINSPVGAFAGRRLSNRNPLVGAPDAYPVTYPLGAQISGTHAVGAGGIDWRAAMVSLPVTHEEYSPPPGMRARPAIGAGITPFTGLHIGASWTAGSYLGRTTPASQLAGRPWHAYEQRLVALDLTASRGYLEVWAEAGRSMYDVPGRAHPAQGTSGYVEARWTFTPRFYVAGRAERNDYPYIEAEDDGSWSASNSDLRDVEGGFGFRPSSHQLVKLTLRRDHWKVEPEQRAYLRDGYAVAMQFSQAFDVLGLVERARR